ncbi:MAG TPA: Maf family protein, partial [Candidatus Saccharimonadia bacterium]|nr:Maf family protein [Candidatus Saccharimonadia bacterium]
FLTAVSLVDARSGSHRSALDRTTVRFRVLAAGEIARYVEREQPLDCAGSFKSETLGIALFESVETSDPTALVGLPLISLCALLRLEGLDPLA